MFQKRRFHHRIAFCNADPVAEVQQRFGGISPFSHAGERGHARVVPAVHHAGVHKALQIALGHDRAGQPQPCKLDLAGIIAKAAVVFDPVVQRAVILKFQRANGVRDALDAVADRVRKVVHRINAPLIPRAMMRGAQHPVNDRVAHVDVGACHVDLGAQHLFAVLELAIFHPLKQAQVFLHAPVAGGAFHPRLRQRAAVFGDLFRAHVANVRLAVFDQFDGKFIHLVKVIACVKLPVPGKTQPLDILLDGVDVFHVLFGGVGVVKTQVALAVVLLFDAEIDRQTLCVPDVQIAVGLGREPGDDLVDLSLGKFFFDDLFNKICVFHSLSF